MSENIIYQRDKHVIKNIENKYILKEGTENPFEAEILKFIYKNTDIPVPKVLDNGIKNNKYYILMEKIDGESLESIWNNLSLSEKNKILKELKKYIYEMRKFKFQYIGSINNKSCYEPFISDNLAGPFKSLEDLNNFRINNLIIDEKYFNDYLNKIKKSNVNFVLTHNDLGPYNIMVKGGKITAILDWELSGSYPDYWEYNRTVYHCGYTDEWKDIMKNLLSEFKPTTIIDNFETVLYYLGIYSNLNNDEYVRQQCKNLAKKFIK